MSKARQRLFNVGANAARSTLGIRGVDTYVCPLCLRGFGREAVMNGTLTLEHVPPRSQGGRAILLTCRPCNSTAGHTVDAALARRDDALAAFPALVGRPTDTPVEGRATVEGVDVNVEIANSESALHLTISPHINDPNAVANWFEALYERSLAGRGSFRLSLRRGFDGARALIGDLKSAYLVAFCSLGYVFILQEGLDLVRRQIQEPDKDLLPRWWSGRQPVFRRTPWLGMAVSPVQAVAVGLRRSTVLLPLGQRAADFYEAVSRLSEEIDHEPLPGFRLPWPRTLELRLDTALKAGRLL